MNFKQKLSIHITGVIFLFFVIFGIIFLFIFSDSSSLKDIISKLFDQKIIFGQSVEYFYFYLFFKTSFMLFGIYFIVYFFVGKYLTHIENYNKKLKDYNHYLAHELKTPISIMSSNLDILKYEYSEKNIQKSKDELKNMTQIINGLLDFSETIQISNKTDINVENFIRKNIFFLLQNKKNTIEIYNKEFNFSIYTDETLFARVVKNLVENAIKYSPDSSIEIEISKEKITFKNNVFVTLDQQELENICHKKYSRSYTKSSGNGVGIPLISEIVKVLGYELKISSFDNTFIAEIIFESK